MVEKWRKTLDEGSETRAILTDLSKALDCIDHNLLLAKLNVYGFEKRSINFIYSYLTKRKQKTKVDSEVSSWEILFSGVILTYFHIDFAGYADDNTPYKYSSKIENVLHNLQGALEKMFHWFSTNRLVANAGKCRLLTSSKTSVDIHISNTEILNEERVKLL